MHMIEQPSVALISTHFGIVDQNHVRRSGGSQPCPSARNAQYAIKERDLDEVLCGHPIRRNRQGASPTQQSIDLPKRCVDIDIEDRRPGTTICLTSTLQNESIYERPGVFNAARDFVSQLD